MSYYGVDVELSFDVPASTVTRAQGGFSEATQDEVIGRWVEKGTGNTVVLVNDGNKPLGVITRITGSKVAVACGPIVRGKRGPNAVLGDGVRVTGATRQESASGTAERGFVKPAVATPTAASLNTSSGFALGGGTATTNNTPGGLEDVLMWL